MGKHGCALRSRSTIPGWCRGWSWCPAIIFRRRARTFLSFAPPAIPLIGDVLRYTIAPLIGQLIKNSVIRKVFAPQRVPRRFSAEFPMGLSLRPVSSRASSEEFALMVPSAAANAPRYMDLSIPVTIMAGTADSISNPHLAVRAIARAIRHSHLILLPGIGHMVHHAAPDDVVDAIEAVGKCPGLSPV